MPGNGHLSSITKYEIWQSALDFLYSPIHEVARAIQVTTVALKSAATVLADNWVIQDGTPTYLMSNNRLQFVSKLFPAVIAHL